MAEQTYMIFHPTRLAYFKWYAIALIFVAIGTAFVLEVIPTAFLPSDYKAYSSLLLIAFGAVLIIAAELLRKNDKYAITNFRIIEKSGIVNIKEDSVYWDKVSNYSLSQNFLDRIFNIGTINMWSTGGEDKPEVTVKKAPSVQKIRLLLDRLIQRR